MNPRDGYVDYESFGAVGDGVSDASLPAERPFPYARCREVRIRGLTTASGCKPRLSPQERMAAQTAVVEED